MVQILFLALLLVPIGEIYVLIQVGSVIGALPTVGLVVATAALGTVLIRAQGLATIERMRESLDRGTLPAVELLEGVCLLVAGALLLTPGFITDALGFLVLVPALRRALVLGLVSRGVARGRRGAGGPAGGAGTPGGRVIEGEFRREDP
jgi:UPF0716 protein FxsA